MLRGGQLHLALYSCLFGFGMCGFEFERELLAFEFDLADFNLDRLQLYVQLDKFDFGGSLGGFGLLEQRLGIDVFCLRLAQERNAVRLVGVDT